MSREARDWAYAQKTGTAGARQVLVALAERARAEDHYAYPGMAELEAMTEQAPRTIRRHLTTLEALGLIARDRKRRPNGTFLPEGFVLRVASGQYGQWTEEQPAANMASGQIGQWREPEKSSYDKETSPAANMASGETNQWPIWPQPAANMAVASGHIGHENRIKEPTVEPREIPPTEDVGGKPPRPGSDPQLEQITREVMQEYLRTSGADPKRVEMAFVKRQRQAIRRMIVLGHTAADILGCLAMIRTYAAAPDLMDVERRIGAWTANGRPASSGRKGAPMASTPTPGPVPIAEEDLTPRERAYREYVADEAAAGREAMSWPDFLEMWNSQGESWAAEGD